MPGRRHASITSARPAQVLTQRSSSDVPAIIDRDAAQEGGLDPTRELQPLEGRIALFGFGLAGMDQEAFMRVHERDVGIETRSDIALAEQTKPLRRPEAQKLSHVVVGHAAFAAFAQHAREQVLGAAKSRFREPDVRRIVLRPLLFRRTAGMIADDPVDLTLEYGLP